MRTQGYFVGGFPDAELVVSAGGGSIFLPNSTTIKMNTIKKSRRPPKKYAAY